MRPQSQEIPRTPGGAHTWSGGLVLLQAWERAPGMAAAGCPWAALMHGPAHPAAQRGRGTGRAGVALAEAVLGTPGSYPPLGAHARCYLKGPSPSARQVFRGAAWPGAPQVSGTRQRYPVSGSTNTSEPLTLFYYIIIK